MRCPGIRTVAFLVLILGSALVTGCGGGTDSPTSPSNQPRGEYSQTDLVVGTGAEAVAGRRLSVHYTLWQYDPTRPDNKGTQYQTSVGSQPFAFTLGTGAVIRGWDQGVVGMRVGGRRRLVLPPELAYGAAGNPPIPGNASLIFEIELLDVL
jgi:FKBP-type peptidyl-prolyl cis-trans isomerase FkpA